MVYSFTQKKKSKRIFWQNKINRKRWGRKWNVGSQMGVAEGILKEELKMHYLEINRVQERIQTKLNQAFQSNFEDGVEPFYEAMEDLEEISKYYKKHDHAEALLSELLLLTQDKVVDEEGEELSLSDFKELVRDRAFQLSDYLEENVWHDLEKLED